MNWFEVKLLSCLVVCLFFCLVDMVRVGIRLTMLCIGFGIVNGGLNDNHLQGSGGTGEGWLVGVMVG